MIVCPNAEQSDVLGLFINGSYCAQCAKFDEARFNSCRHLTTFLVLSFVRRYTRRDYLAHDGDLIQALVVTEIWLYNIGRLAASQEAVDAAILQDERIRRAKLPKCNAYSISLALGIPPQTVRRKVARLIERGWVERNDKGDLHVTATCEAYFNAEFNLETMRDFVSTARATFSVLGIGMEIDKTPRRRGRD
jgi:hypothetical protein